MAIHPDQLRKKTFAVVPKGYDRPEVNRYLAELAQELERFNAEAAGDHASDQNVDANVPAVPAVSEASAAGTHTGGVAEASPHQDKPTAPQRIQTNANDDFDIVGAEISVMLRQAQDSAMKIRRDAESEAQQLIDQVQIDIEADRVAHEAAAGELITRTEERATEIRLSAEDYSRDTRVRADEYFESRHDAVNAELAASESEAAATRQLTAEHLVAANNEASALVEQATYRANDITAEARAQGEEVLNYANRTLQTLLEAEGRARQDLDEIRRTIDFALQQQSIADLDSSFDDGYSTSGQAS